MATRISELPDKTGQIGSSDLIVVVSEGVTSKATPVQLENILKGITVSAETTIAVTTTATANDTAYAVFTDTPCTELIVLNDCCVEIEYQRNATGVAIVIRPGQTRRIVGITNANQIGIRRVDYASGIARSSTITARALTTNEAFVYAGTQNKNITSGGGNTQLDSLVCNAIEIINTTGKIITWRAGGTAAYRRIKDGESVVVTNISNANQVYIKPYDFVANLLRPVQIEAFTSGLTTPLNLSTQATQISSGARIVLDDFNYPLTVGASNVFLSISEQADQKTTLIPKNSTALAFFPTVAGITTNRSANCVDSASGDFLFGTTSVEYTHPGSFAIGEFAPASALATGVDVTSSDIHFEYCFLDSSGVNFSGSNLNSFSVQLHSAGSPASPTANYHTVTISAYAQGFMKLDARRGGTIISYSVPIENFTAAGSGATLTEVTWAKFVIQGPSSSGQKFRPYSIKAVKKARTKAAVVFVFDDLHVGQYTNALPILAKYNYPACLAVDTVVKIGQTNFMTAPQIINAHQRHGWQMIGQVQGGQGNSTTTDTAISPEHAIEQGARFKVAMKALGISGTQDFSKGSSGFLSASGITGNYYDTLPVLKRLYRTSCEFINGNNSTPPIPFGETVPFGDPFAIRRINMSGFTAGTRAARWQELVDQAITNKGVIVFGAHSEFNTAGEGLTALSTLVEYIRSQELLGNIEVLTMDQLVKSAY